MVWLVGRLLPDWTYILRVGLAVFPIATRGWLTLLRERPLLGSILIVLFLTGLALLAWRAPDVLLTMLVEVYDWLVGQSEPAWQE